MCAIFRGSPHDRLCLMGGSVILDLSPGGARPKVVSGSLPLLWSGALTWSPQVRRDQNLLRGLQGHAASGCVWALPARLGDTRSRIYFRGRDARIVNQSRAYTLIT